jgi:hypothetical protein
LRSVRIISLRRRISRGRYEAGGFFRFDLQLLDYTVEGIEVRNLIRHPLLDRSL